MVHDGTVVIEHPHEAVLAGAAAGVPLLIGANTDEFRMFAALAGDSYRPADESWLRAEMARAGVERTRDLLAAYRIRTRTLSGTKPAPDALEELRTLFLSDAVYRVPAIRLARAHTDNHPHDGRRPAFPVVGPLRERRSEFWARPESPRSKLSCAFAQGSCATGMARLRATD